MTGLIRKVGKVGEVVMTTWGLFEVGKLMLAKLIKIRRWDFSQYGTHLRYTLKHAQNFWLFGCKHHDIDLNTVYQLVQLAQLALTNLCNFRKSPTTIKYQLVQLVQLPILAYQLVQLLILPCQLVQLVILPYQVWQLTNFWSWYLTSFGLKNKCVSTLPRTRLFACWVIIQRTCSDLRHAISLHHFRRFLKNCDFIQKKLRGIFTWDIIIKI